MNYWLIGFRSDDRKSFTEEGLAKLIELLTQGEVEIIIENDELTLRPEMADRTSVAVMKVKLANVIACTADRIEQLSVRDAHTGTANYMDSQVCLGRERSLLKLNRGPLSRADGSAEGRRILSARTMSTGTARTKTLAKRGLHDQAI